VAAVAERPERRIAVQEYGRPNLEMNAALEQLGACVTPVALYRWELPADTARLREAARRPAAREFDIILFTSSIQLDHLLRIAREEGVEELVQAALQHGVVVVSVGPVMTETLVAAGIAVDITPMHPKMAAMVRAASEGAEAARTRKLAR